MDPRSKFYDITDLIQQEFDRNLELYGDKIQCRRGCSKCCSQIFRITPLDGWIITEHVKTLPEPERKRLVTKAQEYIKKQVLISASLHEGRKQTDEGLPCPALGSEGECTIYDARPVVCRRFGMPIYDYKNPGSIHACELNFADGEEITDPLLIPNQTKIGKKWDEVKDEYAEVLMKERDTGNSAISIAEAILSAEVK